MSTQPSLPIDEILAALDRALAQQPCAVVQAQPGAGKTSRVPLALLDKPWLAGQRILLLEPRRLAALHAARYMSQLLGESPGQTVGYTIRHQRAVSALTRIEVITEGVLTRRLQHDPSLEGVGLIIFDEFHERNLHSDLGLALGQEIQAQLRPDLKILVMSATVDGEALAAHLGHCPLLCSSGRSFPVTIAYQGDDARPLAQQVVQAVQQGMNAQPGDILVFLPGAAEIRSCQRALAVQPWAAELLIQPLYAALPFAQQQQAILPASRRKVILATNIAETSLTIDGVTVVVDSGLERRLNYVLSSGMNRLQTQAISQASATQRAGRAGRQRAGCCYRLWSDSRQRALLPFTPAEILRLDLSALALELVAWGSADAGVLNWLDAPPAAHLDAAFTLLWQLGATDNQRRLTAIGRRMAELPLPPRLARMVVAATSPAEQALACQLAVILESPQWFAGPRHGAVTDSDLLDRMEQWQPQRAGAALTSADKNYRALCRQLAINQATAPCLDSTLVARLLLAAFPDRVAQQRADNSSHYLLCGGRAAQLSPQSQLAPCPWLVAAEVEQGNDGLAMIHLASRLSVELLLEYFHAQLPWCSETVWDSGQQRVIARQCRRLGALILVAKPVAPDPQQAVSLLVEQLQRAGLELLNWTRESQEWLQRANFVGVQGLEEKWPSFDSAELLRHIEQWLAPWLTGLTQLAQLKKLIPLPALQGMLSWSQRQSLERWAPARITVPSGSQLAIDYSDAQRPLLAVKLQELFGLQTSPTLANGRVAVTLQLLSPAQRPIQQTTDLASFWRTTYSEVKKELKGRYPKHPWPDDPLQALPQRGVKRRN